MNNTYEIASKEILENLNNFKDLYSKDCYYDFKDKIEGLKDKIEESKKEGRKLKIGIVGEVKAGKSSFLNALIFDGKDVLPKASTPMTAALTKISYSENQSAKIVFYSEKDWERVNSISREYDAEFNKFYDDYLSKKSGRDKKNKEKLENKTRGKINSEIQKSKTTIKSKEEMRKIFDKKPEILKLVSCKELTDMFKKSSEDLTEYLGKTKELEISDINEGLEEYIGARGKYTSIVKHVELRINNEILKEIEIVDTPGLNDPIISRGETTKRFLGESDVIFLLSYTGQFLTQQDITFMCRTLPNEGIKNVVIVGSKFDSGLLDDNKSKDIKTAYNSSIKIYNNQAMDNICKCIESGYNIELLERIKNSLPPSYVSAMLFSCAKKKKAGKEYSEEEENIVGQLKKHFSNFDDKYELLLSISGIQQIKKNKVLPVIKEKQQIIDEKNKELLNVNKNILLRLLEDINIEVIQNKEDVENYDKEQLEKKFKMLKNKIQSMRIEVRNIFDKISVEASQFLNNMKTEIEEEMKNHIDFDVETKTRIEHNTVKTGLFGLKKEHYTDEITTYTASISDVISNIRSYINSCRKYANKEFANAINIANLEDMIKETVIGAFDLSGKDFNENNILIPLEIVIKKIQIPDINITMDEFESMIIDEFSGASVKGDDIHKLKLAETRVLGKASEKIQQQLDECEKKMEYEMSNQSATFVDSIIKNLNENVEKLKEQIDNREESIKRYNTFIEALDTYKEMIKKMEM